MYNRESFSKTPQKFISFVNDKIDTNMTILFQGGTGCGKTTIMSLLPKFVCGDKIIFLNLSPSVVISSRIRENQKQNGINTYTFNEFKNVLPTDNIISICDTHSSINSESSKLHIDGDFKGIIKILKEYIEKGYNLVKNIDESGIFITDENNETVKMLKKLPSSLTLHYSATPNHTIHYDKKFVMDNEEIKKTGRVKQYLEIHQQGHNDDYELIFEVLNKREDLEQYYHGNTVSAQFFCETGSEFKTIKKMIIECAKSKGIQESEIIDLSIEGREDNNTTISEFSSKVGFDTKHQYKIIITKYAGSIGLDCPSISVQGILRPMSKKSVDAQIQIFGRGRRIYNGKTPENDIQNTLYVYVKQNHVFPDYLQKEICNLSQTEYFMINDCNVEVFIPQITSIEKEKKIQQIDELIGRNQYQKILEKTFSVTEITKTDNFGLTGKTLSVVSKSDEMNSFDKLNLTQAIDIKNNFKLFLESIIPTSFDYFLTRINITEEQFTIDIKHNLAVRELISNVKLELKKTIKNYQVIGEKKYEFPAKFARHSTNLEMCIDSDSLFYDKVLYLSSNNKIFFDSIPEKSFFESVGLRKQLDWIFQNPRTNQDGISFYIPEYDINHSPDFFLKFKEKTIFVEVTSWDKIGEKEKYIKSYGTPTNYLLVALNSKKELVYLNKETYTEEYFYNQEIWKPINELYVNL